MNAPRHEYSRFDRLTIDGIFYQPDGQNDEFVRLKRLDGSDICSLFTYDDIDKLRGSSGWRLEKDWFAESAVIGGAILGHGSGVVVVSRAA